MSLYLDASVVVSLLLSEDAAPQARSMIAAEPDDLLLSDFARAEFASALARRVRMRAMDGPSARLAFAALDALAARTAPCGIEPADIAQAEAWLRRLDLNLRTPDALHLAAAGRLGARLATLDAAMADAARALGVPLAA